MKSVLLIDVFSLAFRAYYSYPLHLTLSNGQPINAVFGLLSMVFQAIDNIEPDYVLLCFDSKGNTFRNDIYPEYKAHRDEAPDDFKSQVPMFDDVFKACGLSTIAKVGYEADDLIGTAARMANDENIKTLIMTGDQDSFQLVNEKTTILMNKRGVSELIYYDDEAVYEKLSVTPEQVVDFKALKGDASDNIPGVKGVGDKTAAKLLAEYKDLDTLYANIENIASASVQKKLSQDQDKAYISQKLATIDRHVPIEVNWADTLFDPDWEKILAVFKEYQFQNLITRYQGKLSGEEAESITEISEPDTDVTIINTDSALDRLCEILQDSQGFAIDIETTSEEPLDADIVGIAISNEAKSAYYIPLDRPASDTQGHPFLDKLSPILNDESIPKVAHHAKYELAVFRRCGIALNGLSDDTMLLAHILFPLERLGLKALVERHFQVKMQDFETMMDGVEHITEVPLERISQYAGADADYTWRLKEHFSPKVSETLRALINKVELPLIPVLVEMESNGVQLNLDFLKGLSSEFTKELAQISTTIYTAVGEEFNIQSPKQLAGILFDKLGLPVIKKTATGPSTDATVLETLAKQHPVAHEIMRFRKLSKLLNTYVDTLPDLVHSKTGLVHSSFNQMVTATGRLSSTNPNLQNIPIRSAEGGQIRKAFISRFEGGELVSADYSQVELRILAHLSEDPAMIQAFKEGQDIHRATAAMIFSVPYRLVSKEEREHAKAVNFGISYGQSAFALSKQLGISRKDAQGIIDSYYGQFSKIRDFIDRTLEDARAFKSISTLLGRIRPLPGIQSSRHQEKSMAERMAVNTRVQGTAADIMKLAMSKVYRRMKAESLQSLMLIQVHDELVFDVWPGELDRLSTLLREEMEQAFPLAVPLTIDISHGRNWLEQDEYEK